MQLCTNLLLANTVRISIYLQILQNAFPILSKIRPGTSTDKTHVTFQRKLKPVQNDPVAVLPGPKC